jgi:hypothetical protein
MVQLWLRRWAWVLGAMVLAACNPLARDPPVDAEIRKVFDQVRRNESPALLARFDPQFRTAETPAQLATLKRYLPDGEPRARKVIGTNTLQTGGGETTVSASDEYDYGDRVVLVDTRLRRPAGQATWLVQGFHFQVATTKDLARNDFTLRKPASQLLFLAFVIASPLLMIAALVKVIRRPGLRRKWLWGILAFGGLTALSMDWTTGRLSYQLVTVQLLNAGVMKGLSAFSPWVLTATLPVGAVLILTGLWANPRRARRKGAPAPDEAEFQ